MSWTHITSDILMEKKADRLIYIYGSIIIGGKNAPTACDGMGIEELSDSIKLINIKRFELGGDIVMQGDLD